MSSYEFYKSQVHNLENTLYKNPEVKLVFIDDDLGWFPIDTYHPLVKLTKIHGEPVCKIVIWQVVTDSNFIEFSYYIFEDGHGSPDIIIPENLASVCKNWLYNIS